MKKVSLEDYNYLLKLKNEINQYQIAYSDIAEQQLAIMQMIVATKEKVRNFSDQLSDMYNIEKGKTFSINETLEIVMMDEENK